MFLAQLPADFEVPRTSWSLFPSAFLGIRRESPTGLMYRVGAGLNTAGGRR